MDAKSFERRLSRRVSTVRELGAQLIGHGAPLLAGGFERLLGEGGIDCGEDHLAFALAGIRRAVAQDETTQKELTTRSIRTQNPG